MSTAAIRKSLNGLPLHFARHIELTNVPRSATPADIRKAVVRAKLKGVADVAIDYSHFAPSEKALLTLTRPNLLQENLLALQNASIAGIPIKATPTRLSDPSPPRQRGVKGRREAADRGILGNGPHAGLSNGDRNVTIWGFPGKLEPESLFPLFEHFNLSTNKAGQPDIVKIPLPDGAFTMVSRFLLRLASASEAHRLVRQLHLTHWEPEFNGMRYPLRAQIIY